MNAGAIDRCLPQTQCTRCGYPDCLAYAEAVASGETGIDRCPPGGHHTLAALAGQRQLPVPEKLADDVEAFDGLRLAVIREAECIGCTRCIDACPVDAIVGSGKRMHGVVAGLCTGCELCLPPCPVDCIELIPIDGDRPVPPAPTPATAECIRCGQCDSACPEGLPVERLWWVSRGQDLEAAVAAGLDDCIECGLCNPPCPAGIDLTGTFVNARARLANLERADAAAKTARTHVAERQARLARAAAAKTDRRAARLAALKAGRLPGDQS